MSVFVSDKHMESVGATSKLYSELVSYPKKSENGSDELDHLDHLI